MVVKGKNSEIVHNGKRYHVQTELDSSNTSGIVSQVFCSGQVVYQKKTQVKQSHDEQSFIKGIQNLHQCVLSDIKEMMI